MSALRQVRHSWATANNVAPARSAATQPVSYTEYTQDGHVTVTGTWVDDNGNPGTNAPARSWFCIDSGMEWDAEAVGLGRATLDSHAASDAFGDPEVVDMQAGHGISAQVHVIGIDAPGGTWTRDYALSVSMGMTLTMSSSTHYSLDGWFKVSEAPPADDYDFQNYPSPPPPGSTPRAAMAGDCQKQLSDKTAYCTLAPHGAHTNDTAANAVQQLKEDAIFFVLGHGGDPVNGVYKSYQTFWDATGHWSFIVQTHAAAQGVLNDWSHHSPAYTYQPDIQVLDDLPAGALRRALLVVFEGCWTGFWNATYGSPVDGVWAKGAKHAIGWTADIPSHILNPDGTVQTPGAEEWADTFWHYLQQGNTIAQAFGFADGLLVGPPGNQRRMPFVMQSRNVKGSTSDKIVPARYGG